MTLAEYIIEWRYIYAERIGIMCGANEPTAAQKQLASDEADRWCDEIKERKAKP
jgi:hypothetical protein